MRLTPPRTSPSAGEQRAGAVHAPARTLAFDPGATTGYALLEARPRRLSHAGAIPLEHDPASLTHALNVLIVEHAPDQVVIEGWESHGRAIDISSSVPNMIIGILVALAVLRETPFAIAFSSEWKRAYSSGAEHLPASSSRVRGPDEGLARALQHDLGGWPAALDAVPRRDRTHAISAAALALWSLRQPPAALNASRSNPRPSRSAATGETRAATVWRRALARQS